MTKKPSFNTEDITCIRKQTKSSPKATKGYRGEQEEAGLNCTGGGILVNHPRPSTLDTGIAVIRGSWNGLDKHLPGKSGYRGMKYVIRHPRAFGTRKEIGAGSKCITDFLTVLYRSTALYAIY